MSIAQENAGATNLTITEFIELAKNLDPVMEHAFKNYSYGYALDPTGSEYVTRDFHLYLCIHVLNPCYLNDASNVIGSMRRNNDPS